MKTLTSAERQTYLLTAILWIIALYPTIPLLVWNVATIQRLINPNHLVSPHYLAGDFAMFWSAAHMAMTNGATLTYQFDKLKIWDSSSLVGHFTTDPWVYPPPTLLFVMCIGQARFATSVVAWLVVQTVTSVLLLRASRFPWLVITFIFMNPAILSAICAGELSVLTAALFTFALMRADSAPGWAGFSAALTMIKPQMALLGPVMLLARRRWRGVAVGAVTALALLALTTLILGPSIWAAYFRYGAPMSRKILLTPFPTFHRLGSHMSYYEFYGSSVFWMLRSLHADTALAACGQGIAAMAAVNYAWSLWQQRVINPINRVAITLLLGVLISPYGFSPSYSRHVRDSLAGMV